MTQAASSPCLTGDPHHAFHHTLRKRFMVATAALLCAAPLLAQGPPLLTVTPAVETLSLPEKAAIVETLERWVKGYYAMDPDMLSPALHADAVYSGGVGQAALKVEPYAPTLDRIRKLAGKPKPPSPAALRTLTSLSVRGSLAAALVSEEYLPGSRLAGTRAYHAFQLYRSGERWVILASAEHMDRYQGETDARTLDVMGIRTGMTIGEIGAGDGRLTFALARRVGAAGKVYANDIDEGSLAQLRTVRTRKGTKNIETIVGKVDDPLFPKGALDLAIMGIVYHHLEQPVPLLRNLAPSLKPGATLVILDPAYDRTGEKDSDRPTTRERVEAEAREAGYELAAIDASLPRDNIFILRVKTRDGGATPLKTTTAPPTPVPLPDEKAAILAAVDTWWKGHDTDDAGPLEQVLAPGARSWFEHDGLQSISYDREIERIKSGNRRAGKRPAPGETRTVVDFAQQSAVAMVTVRVEIPNGTPGGFCGYTSFQLYKADDQWQVVNMAGYNAPPASTLPIAPTVPRIRPGTGVDTSRR